MERLFYFERLMGTHEAVTHNLPDSIAGPQNEPISPYTLISIAGNPSFIGGRRVLSTSPIPGRVLPGSTSLTTSNGRMIAVSQAVPTVI